MDHAEFMQLAERIAEQVWCDGAAADQMIMPDEARRRWANHRAQKSSVYLGLIRDAMSHLLAMQKLGLVKREPRGITAAQLLDLAKYFPSNPLTPLPLAPDDDADSISAQAIHRPKL